MKRSDMDVAIKATLAQKNSEMEKLEKSKKAHLRMITSAKIKMKANVSQEVVPALGHIDSKSIRMYETHVPGFCYLRNGECRQKITSTVSSANPDPVQCSEMVKAILFTDNELDVCKTMCLHLLGTHVQSKSHIQRKDGRLCSYVKSQSMGNTPHTLQPFSQRASIAPENKVSSKYDKMMPRYILDVKLLHSGFSSSSVRTCDCDGISEEDTIKKRKIQVPVYINNEIRMIVHSVMEALEAVNSPKLSELIDLASSPEELRNMLKNEDMNEFIVELSTKPFITKPTSYDFVMAHLMFDKIPERGTLESVAQVLEICDNVELQSSLSQIRRAILQRHTELVNSNIIPRGKSGMQDKYVDSSTKASNQVLAAGYRQSLGASNTNVSQRNTRDAPTTPSRHRDDGNNFKPSNSNSSSDDSEDGTKIQNLMLVRDGETEHTMKTLDDDTGSLKDNTEFDEKSLQDESRGSFVQNRSNSMESNKFSFQNLSNPQRILFGLKVASLKSKPLNMHQFEGKKKVDLTSILTSIVRTDSDSDNKQFVLHNQISSFSTTPDKKVKKSTSNILTIHTSDFENLTRALLANLRLIISETENKKRVNSFMSTIT